MTKSELMTMMVGGMATIAGGVFAVYAGMGVEAGHLLTASFMAAPTALYMAKIPTRNAKRNSRRRRTGGAGRNHQRARCHVPGCRRRHEAHAQCAGHADRFTAAIALLNYLIVLPQN